MLQKRFKFKLGIGPASELVAANEADNRLGDLNPIDG